MKSFLTQLPKIVQKRKKRIGRGLGSGKGAKSTRGTTRHQKAREGIPLHFEGGQARMVKKFPLLRGKGINKPLKPKPIIVNLDKLNVFNVNDEITVDALIKKGIVDRNAKRVGVKILSHGKLTKKLVIKVPVSANVKAAVEQNKGSVSL